MSVPVGRLFFFFQAEDGIRDLIVTGVQTCALPILLSVVSALESLAIGTVSSDSSAETTLSIPANVGLAEAICVTIVMDPTTSDVSITDNAGNTYTKYADVTDGSDTSGVRTLIFRAPVAVALAGNTITVNFPAPTPAEKTASFFSFNGVGTLDRTHTAVGNDNGPNSGATAITRQPSELLIGALGIEDQSVQFASLGDSFQALAQGTTGAPAATDNVTAQPTYRVVSSTGTYAASGTMQQPASRLWAAAIATYRLGPRSPPPATTNPSNQNVVSGQDATFVAAASGDSPPTVQWQGRTGGGTTREGISRATRTTPARPGPNPAPHRN